MRHGFLFISLAISVLLTAYTPAPVQADAAIHLSLPLPLVEKTTRADPRNIRLEQIGDQLRITGQVRRRGHKALRIQGHVDLDLLDSDGNLLERRSAPLRHRGRSVKHQYVAYFSTSFSKIPEKTHAIRIKPHSGKKGH